VHRNEWLGKGAAEYPERDDHKDLAHDDLDIGAGHDGDCIGSGFTVHGSRFRVPHPRDEKVNPEP
jgi:hypothetical protein